MANFLNSPPAASRLSRFSILAVALFMLTAAAPESPARTQLTMAVPPSSNTSSAAGRRAAEATMTMDPELVIRGTSNHRQLLAKGKLSPSGPSRKGHLRNTPAVSGDLLSWMLFVLFISFCFWCYLLLAGQMLKIGGSCLMSCLDNAVVTHVREWKHS